MSGESFEADDPALAIREGANGRGAGTCAGGAEEAERDVLSAGSEIIRFEADETGGAEALLEFADVVPGKIAGP